MVRSCVLYDRECIGCGECDRCDLDPDCMKCIQGDAEFRGIVIDGIRLENESAAGNLPENLP